MAGMTHAAAREARQAAEMDDRIQSAWARRRANRVGTVDRQRPIFERAFRRLLPMPPARIEAMIEASSAICQKCGCIDDAGCDGGCSWARKYFSGLGLCSRCVAAA